MVRSPESENEAGKPAKSAAGPEYLLVADSAGGNGPNPFAKELPWQTKPPRWQPAQPSAGDGRRASSVEKDQPASDESTWRQEVIKLSRNAISDAKAIQTAIDKAASSREPTVISVPPGSYKGQISFPDGARNIHLKALIGPRGERAVFDMAGVSPTADKPAVFYLQNARNISIEGFELTNFKSDDKENPAAGIIVEGVSRQISIRDNLIHHFGIGKLGSKADLTGSEPISVRGRGTTEETATRQIVISNNTLHDINLGSHEGITVNGNVDGFLVALNNVRNVNNIGIDIVGGYRVSSNPRLDAARNGVVRGNFVAGIDSDRNRAYKTGDRSAGGIYVDGGWNVRIENNVVEDTNRGIEVGCENAGHTARSIEITNNISRRNHFAAVTVGAGDRRHGSTDGVRIFNNLFMANGPDGITGIDRQLFFKDISDSNNRYLDRSGRLLKIQ